METRELGSSGLRVSALGFGAGEVGGDELTGGEAERLLGAVLDLGVTLIDTARSYGRAEERIGRALGRRRADFVLSTKGGYGATGADDWTYDAVARGIDEALVRLRTTHIDVFHLHSCPREVLDRGDVVRALEAARAAGKIRVAAYSGENEALGAAVAIDVIGSVQCSVNVADQAALGGAIARGASRGLGVIGKRPLANAAWRFAQRPHGDPADGASARSTPEVYWQRLRAMAIAPPDGMTWAEMALRFSAFAPGVSSVIAGSRSLAHVRENAAIVGKGALPAGVVDEVRGAFAREGAGWRGEI
jgi:aryl-alcohol dehydrogenase-like predicted oxidoreductase